MLSRSYNVNGTWGYSYWVGVRDRSWLNLLGDVHAVGLCIATHIAYLVLQFSLAPNHNMPCILRIAYTHKQWPNSPPSLSLIPHSRRSMVQSPLWICCDFMLTSIQTTVDLSPPQVRKKKKKQPKQQHQSRKGLIGSKAIQVRRTFCNANF
jgi:hypothetical protein